MRIVVSTGDITESETVSNRSLGTKHTTWTVGVTTVLKLILKNQNLRIGTGFISFGVIASGRLVLVWEREVKLGKQRILVPLCQPQIPHGQAYGRTRGCKVRTQK